LRNILKQMMAMFALATPAAASADSLGRLEWLIDKRFDVPQMTVAEAQAALRESPQNWLVLDVREAGEYAVSRLPSAVRVPPDADADAFMRAVGDSVNGMQLLFYCSVGQRSSKLADRVQEDVTAAGGLGVANLRGGIFRWHSEHGPLVNAEGPVDRIHPYNAIWGRLMPRDNPDASVDAGARPTNHR
jgi:rhodanese-related sulfurtransferase